MIESELRKYLSFGFSMEENLTTPGSPSFGKGDIVQFRVWIRNDGDLRFGAVSGIICSTVTTEFKTRRFEMRNLDPCQEKEVARIRARILDDPRGMSDCGWIAKLTVVASADLERIEVRESERFLGYTSSANIRYRRAESRRSIPLSDAPPSLG